MSRTVSNIFKEEASRDEQSRIFKLITLELADTYVFGTAVQGSTTITVSSAVDFVVGQRISIDGITGTFTIVDVLDNIITINSPLPSPIVDAKIEFTLILNVADSNYDVEYGGVTYIRFPIAISETTISSDGTIDRASLSVANVTREIMYYVETYDGLVNRKVVVRTVFARFLDKLYTPQIDGTVTETDNPEKDPNAHIKEEFLIDTYNANEKVVVFTLDPVVDLEIKIPRRRYMDSNSCTFRYKDPETCKYSGSLPTCYKNLEACKAHGNSINFGGFAGLDSTNQRRIWL